MPSPTTHPQPAAVTGVQLMKGIGVRESRGFWAEAWSIVLKRRTAVLALCWLSIVAFFAVFAPILASGHPMWMRWTDSGGVTQSASPLWRNLAPLDVALLLGAIVGVPVVLLTKRGARARAAWTVIGAMVLVIAILAITGVVQQSLLRSATEQSRAAIGAATDAVRATPLVREWFGGYVIGGVVALLIAAAACFIPAGKRTNRIAICGLAAIVATLSIGSRWVQPLQVFNYSDREIAGELSATYTVVPWSPSQRYSDLQRLPPASRFGEVRSLPETSPPAPRRFWLGTDAFGQDVLTQILHACRLSISIGVVSTCIALLIGVTIGALMGYFGGWVDLLLYRVVEVFMAVPVLFLLIVAVAVLPDELKTTYVIMGIIGCFTWTGMARFTRAEFMKLRNQDFVQAAEAAGLPLRSVLFKHMLPNGVAPVLVDTSFAVAAAISVEAVLSYLGLGPVDSPSWGKLLSSAISQEGEFKWWLAVFPGAAIFLTVLSYNILGEALRDAIDPKLKKARV
jgi:peptide/nickel transport system permease protein